MTKVVVAGNFFVLHDGHINHLEEARKLGDYLIAIIGSDDYLMAKGKKIFLSLENRKKQLMAWADEVVEVIDKDGTCAETLRMLSPDIFAKSKDRTFNNMPQKELEVCKEIGCRIVYGVGNKYLGLSSSEVAKSLEGTNDKLAG